jgi:Putative quorum-sensing-regulated virulence factor
MTMPFGKFKGQSLTELDDPYLLWLMLLEDLRDPLLTAINGEADRRMGNAMSKEM